MISTQVPERFRAMIHTGATVGDLIAALEARLRELGGDVSRGEARDLSRWLAALTGAPVSAASQRLRSRASPRLTSPPSSRSRASSAAMRSPTVAPVWIIARNRSGTCVEIKYSTRLQCARN